MTRRVRDKVIGHARIIQRIGDQYRVEVFTGPVGKHYMLERKEILISEGIGSEGLLVIRKIGARLAPQLLPD